MYPDRVVAAALIVALAATGPAFAQESSSASHTRSAITALPPIGSLQASISRVGFERAVETRDDIGAQSSTGQTNSRGSVLGRLVMAGVVGVGGFLAGGYLGARIEGPCDCDDPGLKGALIGAPIGGVVGAIVGWKLGGLLSR